MVQPGRVVCIFTPFVLSIAALACMVVVFLAGTVPRNHALGDLYFIKIDTRNLNLTDSPNHLIGDAPGHNITDLEGYILAAKEHLDMKDIYSVYLSNYCMWYNDDAYAQCSARQSQFWFDPIKYWNLNNNTIFTDNSTQILPPAVQNGLQTYRKLSIALFYLYAIGTAAAAATILVGISAIFSRWGSFFTTFFASTASLFILVASALATSMFGVLKGVLTKALDDEFGTKTTFGTKIYAVTWIGAAFAFASALFWTLSICCCSGRSPYNPGSKSARKTRAEMTPYTYERVGSPLHNHGDQYQGPSGTQSTPLANLAYKMPGFGGSSGNASGQKAQRDNATAYEPFRAHV